MGAPLGNARKEQPIGRHQGEDAPPRRPRTCPDSARRLIQASMLDGNGVGPIDRSASSRSAQGPIWTIPPTLLAGGKAEMCTGVPTRPLQDREPIRQFSDFILPLTNRRHKETSTRQSVSVGAPYTPVAIPLRQS